MGAQADRPGSWSWGGRWRSTDGRRGEESRPYLRQLIRDTHIAGQLFKAHSCITQPKVPVGSLLLPIHPGLEGQGGGVERTRGNATDCLRSSQLRQRRSKSFKVSSPLEALFFWGGVVF